LLITHQDKQHVWMLVASTPSLTAMLTMRVPDTAREAYSERTIRALLSSVAVRAEVPVEEQLTLLPFRVKELAGFKVGALLTGRRGVLLTEASGTASTAGAPGTLQPQFIISVLPGEAAESADRDDLARQIFRSFPGLAEVRITGSEPIRLSGQQGHEIMANAKEAASGAALSLVQWLRFGSGAYLHMIGMAPTPAWPQAYARFRAVRDGIEIR
jgi:hypothetical protein